MNPGAFDTDTGYMMCFCGQWVCSFHRDCLALNSGYPNQGRDKTFAELARAEASSKWQKVADQDDEDACRIANKLSRSNP